MGSFKTITNPSAAYGQTDAESNQYQEVADFVAATAITKGDGVAVIWDETARTLVAHAWDTNASGQTAQGGIGVALNTVAIGQVCKVVVFGFALANIGSDTPALGEGVVGSTTAGVLASVASDATTVTGTVLGVTLGDEDGATNLVPMWVSPR